MIPEPPLYSDLVLTRRSVMGDQSARSVQRRVRAGELRRLRRGVAVETGGVDPHRDTTFLRKVVAVAATRRRPAVFSHFSASAIWGLPHVGPWPATVDVIVEPNDRRRSKNGVVVHRDGRARLDLLEWGDHRVTSVAQTIADLARDGHGEAAVVALDYVLGEHCPPELRVTRDEVRGILDQYGKWGMTRARAAVDFADGRSGSPGESSSRVAIMRLGFPVPQVQLEQRLPDGGLALLDFAWPAEQARGRPLAGEFDGLVKYSDEGMLRGRSSADVVVAEKRREDALRRLGYDVARWTYDDVRDPRRLERILLAHGLRRRN